MIKEKAEVWSGMVWYVGVRDVKELLEGFISAGKGAIRLASMHSACWLTFTFHTIHTVMLNHSTDKNG